MRKEITTFVFSERYTSGAIAIGCADNRQDAMLDAIERLGHRFPNIEQSPNHLELLRLLRIGNVVVRSETYMKFPSQEIIGEYASAQTMELAASLSSNARSLWKGLSRAKYSESKDVKDFVVDNRLGIPLNEAYSKFIDWEEVVLSLPDYERPSREQDVLVDAKKIVEPFQESTQSIKGRPIDKDVLGVLAECSVDGNFVRLPDVKLDPNLYKRVNEVLVALGGKWKGGKVFAHVFPESPEAQLALSITTGTFEKPQDYGFFPTQPAEVARVIELANLEPGMLFAEPSAGDGAIAKGAAEVLGVDSVHTYELLPSNVRKLKDAGFSNVFQGDFLAIEPNPIYDVIVMNPPFGGGADVIHVQHAARFLKPTGRLIAITGPAWERVNQSKFEKFREFVEDSQGVVETIEAGAFKAAGTNIETRIISFDACNFPWNAEKQVERVREIA